MFLVPAGCPWCLWCLVFGAWVSLVPGCPWCLGVLGAWVSLVPGCPWHLGVLGTWVSLMVAGCLWVRMGVLGVSGALSLATGACVSLVPGCPWCLCVFGAWVSLAPGCPWRPGVHGARVSLVSLVPCPWRLGVLGAWYYNLLLLQQPSVVYKRPSSPTAGKWLCHGVRGSTPNELHNYVQ